jgi:hypothetical protein
MNWRIICEIATMYIVILTLIITFISTLGKIVKNKKRKKALNNFKNRHHGDKMNG